MLNQEQIINIFKYTQKELKEFLRAVLMSTGYEVHEGKYLFGIPSGDVKNILIVSHMDTVHKEVADVYYCKEKNSYTSPQGIGGDDRCGIIATLELILNGYNPYVLFTEDEECGGVGVKDFVKDFPTNEHNLKFAIEFDRKGSEDAVFYSCDNKEFHALIESYGFKKSTGSYSDIVDISNAWDIASVNLSSGYYNAHRKEEYVMLNELYNNIEKVKFILEQEKELNHYKYEKKVYEYKTSPVLKSSYGTNRQYYGYYYDDDYYYNYDKKTWEEKDNKEKYNKEEDKWNETKEYDYKKEKWILKDEKKECSKKCSTCKDYTCVFQGDFCTKDDICDKTCSQYKMCELGKLKGDCIGNCSDCENKHCLTIGKYCDDKSSCSYYICEQYLYCNKRKEK